MEFKGLKIDLNALAALMTAIGGLWMAIKGAKQRKKNKEDNDHVK